MNNSSANTASRTPLEPDTNAGTLAIGLLTLEQRFEALDRLYNEEIANLCRELTRLKAEYVRLQNGKSIRQRREKLPRASSSHTPLEA